VSSAGRAIGLDVHLEFCEVTVCENGQVRPVGRVDSTPEALEASAASMLPTDRVALEVMGASWEIVRILEPHVASVVVVSPGDTGIAHARAKTDRLDARTLARLLWVGELDGVWTPDEHTRVLRRRLSRREQLVRSRPRCKNEIHAVLMRRLKGCCPYSDMFGKSGRQWLRWLELPVEECETVESTMRQIEFLDAEIAEVDRLIAKQTLLSGDARRLLTVPGVNVVCAATFLAAIGDIRRFRTSRQLVAYLGLDPKVRQSGSDAALLRRISKQGSPRARWALVEATHSVILRPGRCARFTSGSAPAAATRWRAWPRRGNSPACSGAYSRATRTTPTPNRL
jgi:hypothetical protein